MSSAMERPTPNEVGSPPLPAERGPRLRLPFGLNAGQAWLHVSWLVLLCVLVSPVVAALFRGWIGSIWDHGHGPFVPFAVAYLCYRTLRQDPVKEEAPSAWGLVPLVAGVGLIALDAAMQTEFAGVIGMLLIVPALSLLLLGPHRTRAITFPMLMLLFMIPVPVQLTGPVQYALRRISTEGTAWLLHLIDVPVYAQGTILFMEHITLSVIEGCSGFSALYAAVTIGVVLAYLSRSWKRRVVLLLIPFPLAMGVNIVRIFLLALLAEYRGVDVLETWLHPASGWLVFLLASGLMFLFAERRPPAGTTA
jgi:exosortase